MTVSISGNATITNRVIFSSASAPAPEALLEIISSGTAYSPFGISSGAFVDNFPDTLAYYSSGVLNTDRTVSDKQDGNGSYTIQFSGNDASLSPYTSFDLSGLSVSSATLLVVTTDGTATPTDVSNSIFKYFYAVPALSINNSTGEVTVSFDFAMTEGIDSIFSDTEPSVPVQTSILHVILSGDIDVTSSNGTTTENVQFNIVEVFPTLV